MPDQSSISEMIAPPVDQTAGGNPVDDSDDATVRPRIHPATYVVLFGVFAVWAFLALPGKRYVFDSPAGVEVSLYRHGWPAIHLDRSKSRILNIVRTTPSQAIEDARYVLVSQKMIGTGADGRQLVFIGGEPCHWIDEEFDDGPYWLERNWSPSADAIRIRWGGLALNLLVFGILFAGLGFLLNRRFRKRGFRVSLKELALVTVVISLLCMYYSSAGIFEKNRIALEELDSVKLYDQADRYDVYPDVLVRLTGRRVLPRTNHFRSLVVDFAKMPSAERDVLSDEFRSLRYLLIAKMVSLDAEMGWCLKYLDKAEELTLVGPKIEDRQWTALGRMNSLVTFRVSATHGSSNVVLPSQFFDAIAKADNLDDVELVACEFRSDDFASLAQCKSLNRMTLQDCRIDDAVLKTVEDLSNLVYFNVKRSDLTTKQFERLTNSCPKLVVVR